MNTDTLTQHGRAIYAGDILVAQVFTEADKGIPESAAFLGDAKTLPTDCQGDAAARLLTSAPDLLAALEEAQHDLADMGELSAEAIAMFAPAIAKAKGGTL